MKVAFQRTGPRRYAVIVRLTGEPERALDPAPGYDDDIPHDLVHYVVEAELGLTDGVYGRAARGAGTFISTAQQDVSPRERARKQRKQQKRERALGAHDARHGAEMARSERLAALCDVGWRRKHGQRADPGRSPPALPAEDAGDIERIVARLDALAPRWRALLVGAELVFEWPGLLPIRERDERWQIGLPLGTLDDEPGVRLSAHVWVSSKAPWWEITDALPQYAERLALRKAI